MSQKSENGGGKKIFFIIYFGLLMLALGLIGMLDSLAGWKMIEGSAPYFMLGLLICSALIALTVFLVHRVRVKWGRFAIGIAGGLVVLTAAVVMFMFISVMQFYQIPRMYNILRSGDGRQAVIMQTFSDDLERMDLRAETRRAQDGSDETEYELSDLGVIKRAYPRKLLLFYDSKRASEGWIETGYASEALLKYEWNAAGLHMYLENPEPGDEGELTLSMEAF